MSKQGLAAKLEKLFIDIFTGSDVLRGVPIKTHAQAGKADVNCIVVKCEVGNKNLAAFGGFEYSLEATYRSADGNSDRNDAMEGAMRNAAFSLGPRPGMSLATKELEFVIEEDSDTNRNDSKNLRRRVVRFSGVAAEKS